jgi:CheY-like chemotaxis protein
MNVYLIDDDATFVFLTKRIIKSTGVDATIFVFNDGRQAIDFLVNNSSDKSLMPDVIFLDLSMPVMDGWEFLDEYKALPLENVTLYVFSSSISAHDIHRARSYSMVTDFIIKPITKDRFQHVFSVLNR